MNPQVSSSSTDVFPGLDSGGQHGGPGLLPSHLPALTAGDPGEAPPSWHSGAPVARVSDPDSITTSPGAGFRTLRHDARGYSAGKERPRKRAPSRLISPFSFSAVLLHVPRPTGTDMRRLTLLIRFEPQATAPSGDPPGFDVKSGPGTVTLVEGDDSDLPAAASYETHVTMADGIHFLEEGEMTLDGGGLQISTV